MTSLFSYCYTLRYSLYAFTIDSRLGSRVFIEFFVLLMLESEPKLVRYESASLRLSVRSIRVFGGELESKMCEKSKIFDAIDDKSGSRVLT